MKGRLAMEETSGFDEEAGASDSLGRAFTGLSQGKARGR